MCGRLGLQKIPNMNLLGSERERPVKRPVTDSKEEQIPSHAQAPFNGMRAHRPSCCILGHISPMSVFAAMMDPRKWDPKKKICPSQS